LQERKTYLRKSTREKQQQTNYAFAAVDHQSLSSRIFTKKTQNKKASIATTLVRAKTEPNLN